MAGEDDDINAIHHADVHHEAEGAQQQGGAQQQPVLVNAATIKLPEFYMANPDIWFARAEALF